MRAVFPLALAAIGGAAASNFELLAPRNVMIEEAPPMYMAQCPTCCTETIWHTTIRETYYSTVTETETIRETATEHDASTRIQYTTQFVTKTDVSTFTTSYPVTVTSLINCTKKPAPTTLVVKRTQNTHPKPDAPLECDTVTTTAWKTVTSTDHVVSTKTVLVPTVSVLPTIVTDIETVKQIHDNSITIWVPTTYTATITRTSKYPVVVTSEHDVTVTSTATTTETVVTTLTTSYAVITHDTVTRPGPTVSLPGTTVTETASPTEITLCPSPTGFHRPLDPNSNMTFGCYPGTICIPLMPDGCNMWPGPPSDDFLCCASDCIPSPPFTLTRWRDNDTGYFPPSYGYFNLDPTVFGLSYDLFKNPKIEHGRHGRDEGGMSVSKRAAVPMQCFDECNNVYIVAEAGGKTDELCRDGSAFRVGFDLCQSCIRAHADVSAKPTDSYVGPVFAQFLNFCKGRRSEPTTPPVAVPPGSSNRPGLESEVASRPLETSTQATASSGGFEPVPTSTVVSQPSSVPAAQSSTPAPPPQVTSSAAPALTRPSTTVATGTRGTPVSSSAPKDGHIDTPAPHSNGASGPATSTVNPGGILAATDITGRVTNSLASGKAELTFTTHSTHSSSSGVKSAGAASITISGGPSLVASSGTSASSTPGDSPPVVFNGAANRVPLGETAQTLLVAMLVFVLV